MNKEYLFVRSSKASSAIWDKFPQMVFAITAFFCFLIEFAPPKMLDPVKPIG